MKNPLVKILVTIGSVISIGFGLWHFFVPSIWNWYSYFDKTAIELVLAVRTINIFFSLVLVLLGIALILRRVTQPPHNSWPLSVILRKKLLTKTIDKYENKIFSKNFNSVANFYCIIIPYRGEN